MEPIRPGICTACDTTVIWYRDAKGKIIFTDKYSEFSLALSDGTVAVHAICTDCNNTLTNEKVAHIFSRIKTTWQKEMVGWASQNQFVGVDNMVADAWDNGPDHKRGIIQKSREAGEKRQQKKLKEARHAVK